MKTRVVVLLLLAASVCYAQPSSTLFYGPKDLNFNILDFDSLQVWQTERDGHGIWWQDNATKDVFFLRTDTIGVFLWYLDNSAQTWTNIWSVDASGAVVSDSTYLGDLTVGDDLIVTDDVRADSVYARVVKTSGAVSVGTTLGVTGASTQDSVYARTVKTSGAVSIGTTLGITGASTTDSVYSRTVKLSGALIAGTSLTLPTGSAAAKKVDSVVAIHADTLALYIGGIPFVLPKRP